jgi:tetratricopeptide (TPR) repeat protein
MAFVAAAGLTARAYLRHGSDAYNWGTHAAAIHRLQACLQAHPCDAPTLLAIADEYERAYDPWSAMMTLRGATLICPLLDGSLHRHVLTLLMGQHQWSEAVRAATRLINLHPELADPYYQRGYAEQMDGEPVRAAMDYAEALHRDPLHNDAGTALANLFTSVGRTDVATRINAWKRLRAADVTVPLPPFPSFEHDGEYW